MARRVTGSETGAWGGEHSKAHQSQTLVGPPHGRRIRWEGRAKERDPEETRVVEG